MRVNDIFLIAIILPATAKKHRCVVKEGQRNAVHVAQCGGGLHKCTHPVAMCRFVQRAMMKVSEEVAVHVGHFQSGDGSSR